MNSLSSDMSPIEIGQRIAEERKRLGLNQDEFGEVAGVKRRAQSAYENGERSPDADYLARIASAGADVYFILTGRRTHREAVSEPGAEYRAVNKQQAAILDLIAELGDEGLREIQAAAEKEKRLKELEALVEAARKKA